MKKVFFFVLVSFISIIHPKNISAQGPFQAGDNMLGAGLGFGASFGPGTFGSAIPAISAQYEHGTWAVGGPGVISLGGYIGFKAFSYDYDNAGFIYHQKWSY